MMDNVADTLAEQGWLVLPAFLPLDKVRELRELAQAEWGAGGFRAAGVGREQELNVDESIRGDHVQWLERAESGVLAEYQAFMEDLRVNLNRSLYLGLVEFEAHFAVYPPGTFYRRHLDNFRGSSTRIITAILYLNEGWEDGDCGQLRLYTDGSEGGDYVDVFPHAGQWVLFRSAKFWHEVLPGRRDRFSLTGWLRTHP